MQEVKFLPWIGNNYLNSTSGKRVLILGESHYCKNPATEAVSQITQNVMEDLFNPNGVFEPYKNTYTKFERALQGSEIALSDKHGKRKVWNDVMFYNYVQEAMTGPREAPTSHQFKQSGQAFFEVINQHIPQKIIVWGSRLYNHLPQQGCQLADLIDSTGKAHEVWSYPLTNGQIVEVIKCTHPSAGFAWDYWHEVFKLFINR